MKGVDLNKPGERNKLIGAIALGVVAIIFLWWTFFGFGSSNQKPKVANVPAPSPGPRQSVAQAPVQTPEEIRNDLLKLRPVTFDRMSPPVTEARRNIFAFYEPPARPLQATQIPTPTPTPTPPVLLATVSPANVYARTADFTLEVSGDKFTPDLKVTMDGRILQTKYTGPQQLSAEVPASLIANPGPRQVVLQSPDGKSYSNPIVLSVAQPPTPNYTYVGIIGTKTHVDTAIVQDRGNRDMLNVQRGDVLGGRFRITSISEKELVLVDTSLKIRHTLAFTAEAEKGFNPLQRPTPKVDSEDDEP